jgi:hypothetical protein
VNGWAVDSILTVTIPGDLTNTAAEPLRPSIYGVLEKQGNARTWKIFRLELTAAKMVDSVGLNFIVSLLKNHPLLIKHWDSKVVLAQTW